MCEYAVSRSTTVEAPKEQAELFQQTTRLHVSSKPETDELTDDSSEYEEHSSQSGSSGDEQAEEAHVTGETEPTDALASALSSAVHLLSSTTLVTESKEDQTRPSTAWRAGAALATAQPGTGMSMSTMVILAQARERRTQSRLQRRQHREAEDAELKKLAFSNDVTQDIAWQGAATTE